MIRKLRQCIIVAAVAAGLVPAAHAAENIKFKLAWSEFLDGKGGYLKSPEGIACAGSSVVVADTGNGRLVRYQLQNGTLNDPVEIKVSQVSYPTKVRLGSGKEIFVLDGKQRRIVRLTPEGAFSSFVELPGLVPKSFAVDSSDMIHIVDLRREQVVTLDPAGKKLGEIPFPASYGFISDIAVDAKGNTLLLDSVGAMVHIAPRGAKEFKPLTGSLKEYLEFPSDIITDLQGKMFITDQNGGAVILLGQDGSFQGRQLNQGRKGGLVNYPAQACLNEEGDFILADRNNSRIQLFKLIR